MADDPDTVTATALDSVGAEPFVFVFVQASTPAAAQNQRLVGSIISPALMTFEDARFAGEYVAGKADFLPFLPNPKMANAVSFYTLGVTLLYRVEYDAERVRRQWFPDAPSRLSAVFAFQSPDDCVAASKVYGWSLEEVRRCRIASALRARTCNMGVVSIARSAYAFGSIDEQAAAVLWRAYWENAPTAAIEVPSLELGKREALHAGHLPEYLIDGRLDIDRGWKSPWVANGAGAAP